MDEHAICELKLKAAVLEAQRLASENALALVAKALEAQVQTLKWLVMLALAVAGWVLKGH